MKKIILGFAALLCCIVSVQAQEKYYGIKSGIVKYVTDDGTSTIEQTVWFDNYGDKQTTIQVTKIPGFGETKMYIIYLGDKMYSINDNMSEARESQRPPLNFLNPSPGFKLTELGKEKVLGKECTKYSYKQKQLLGSSTNTVWVWQGIVLKSSMKQGKREVVFEPEKFTPNAKISDSVFKPKTYLKK